MFGAKKTKQKEWLKSKARFTKQSLLIKNYQAIQRWEIPYMKNLALVVTSKGGRILEIGFGLGLSAKYIQKSKKFKKHIVIEAHSEVVKYAMKLFPKQLQNGKMQIFQGFWEDITPLLKDGQFDGILFDTSPVEQETVFFHFFSFFKEAFRLLKKGGVFTYFSDEPKEISQKHRNLLKKAGFKKIYFRICKVKPPKYCRYWRHRTIVVPIVHK